MLGGGGGHGEAERPQDPPAAPRYKMNVMLGGRGGVMVRLRDLKTHQPLPGIRWK